MFEEIDRILFDNSNLDLQDSILRYTSITTTNVYDEPSQHINTSNIINSPSCTDDYDSMGLDNFALMSLDSIENRNPRKPCFFLNLKFYLILIFLMRTVQKVDQCVCKPYLLKISVQYKDFVKKKLMLINHISPGSRWLYKSIDENNFTAFHYEFEFSLLNIP